MIHEISRFKNLAKIKNGHYTLHIMGVIQIITPKSSVLAEEPLSRTKQVISAKDFAAEAHVPIQVYHNNGVVGYSKITAQNFAYESDTTAFLRKIDTLWLYGKWNNLSLPGWNGYIERLSSNSMDFSISRILFLPFIPQPASVYNTIYTTLLCALENAKRYGHDVCIVTFDQPLYTEAREIVAAAPDGSDLSKIVIRLGGFNLLSSFSGAVGYIMQGNGIKEVLSLIYVPNSLGKMLTGHAYVRAVRVHTLLHLTLATIISRELLIDDYMDANLQNTIEDVKNNTISYNDIENCDEKTEALLYQCNKKLKQYVGRGSTGKLWIQYFHMVSIAKEFIRAERMGGWRAHLNCVKEMIPYFHAPGHFPYAKSTYLYLQDMLQLKNLIDPSVFRTFIQGFLTVRHSAKFNYGTSTDMITEKSLMKSMQTDGVNWFGRLVVKGVGSGVRALSILCPSKTDEVTLVVIGIGGSGWR
ncbi:hypothetical protein AVEN_158429-1 [Araneus ventricosus]|uniref:Uncharacterized protein n=1 Tax=Araneus ventricosus TaxID=182803 RepID=A0A4Y2JQN5_ARAVE|nr:hypothetical protein AVEN_158429-1 [Araneus ventricosus]